MQHQLLKYIVLEDAITLLEANLLIFVVQSLYDISYNKQLLFFAECPSCAIL